MSDFNVLVRKKQNYVSQNSFDKNSKEKSLPKTFFYDRSKDSYEELEYISPRLIPNRSTNENGDFLIHTNKAFIRKKINSLYCPVCFDTLNDRVKRVYSKRIEGKVYLPFLDFSKRDGIEKVKMCYSCYKHIVTQWKEYNRSEIPHEERVYWDRNGNFIPSTAEENELRYNRMLRANESNIIHFDDESDIDSKLTTSNEEIFYVPRKSQVYQHGLIEYNFDDLLAEVNRQIGRIEVSTRISLSKTRKEIEKIIDKHNQQMQSEINNLRHDADMTQLQVNNMRQQINDIYDHKGPLLKRRRKKAIGTDLTTEQRKPFL